VTSYILEEEQRAAAISYLRQKLGAGRTVPRLLLESVDFSRGAGAVLNAAALSESQITEFNWGHVPPAPESAQSRVATHGTEIYHILATTERNRGKIQDAIREAESLPAFVGAIGRQPPDRILADAGDATISAGQVRTFAKTADCIFVGAYGLFGMALGPDGWPGAQLNGGTGGREPGGRRDVFC
jgi:hypothetical protein